MKVVVPAKAIEAMRAHAERGYPDEVCGFLIGVRADGSRDALVRSTRAAPNVFEGVRRTRFVIHPRELIGLEDELEGSGKEILGFYHSHPDHPARPSTFDRDNAWPSYVYIVVGVAQGRAGEVTAWVLRDDRSAFDPVSLETDGSP